MTLVLVLAGGAVGAPLRYLVDRWVQSRLGSVLPWGTVLVNVLGCVLLGAVAGGVDATDGPDWLLALVGTGLCGAFTTFSTFSFEGVRLLEQGEWRAAALAVGSSVSLGLAGCALAWAAASAALG